MRVLCTGIVDTAFNEMVNVIVVSNRHPRRLIPFRHPGSSIYAL
jgi:hypothetical protein